MKVLSVLAAAPLLAACTQAPPPVVPIAISNTGQLGPGDVFLVNVYEEAEISGAHRVAPDGTVDVPLVGRVHVAGKTASEVSEQLTAQFERYVKSPNVSIFVKEFNSQKIYVFGQVQKPGTFKYEQGMNIVQAITLAGGFTKFASKNGTYLTRMIEGREERVKVAVEDIGEGRVPNQLLEPGDIVYVPESVF